MRTFHNVKVTLRKNVNRSYVYVGDAYVGDVYVGHVYVGDVYVGHVYVGDADVPLRSQ